MTAHHPLLRVENLVISTTGPEGEEVRLIDDISFTVEDGEVVAIVGESGSGKSLTVLAIMGLLPVGVGVTQGSIRWRGKELVGLRERELRKMRGHDFGMIFQDPMTALNPVFTVGFQIVENLRYHTAMRGRQLRAKTIFDGRNQYDEQRVSEHGLALYPVGVPVGDVPRAG